MSEPLLPATRANAMPSIMRANAPARDRPILLAHSRDLCLSRS
jgi:hypothetical protein